MTDFLSSAFGYINNFSGQSKGAVLNGIVEIGTVKLRVKKVIAEGILFSLTNIFLFCYFMRCAIHENHIICVFHLYII